MDRWALTLVAAVLVTACGGDGEGSPAGAGGAGGSAPVPIADHQLGPFEPWALPIEDYKAVGEAELPGVYQAGILELMPHEDRLWIGYGDANYNMGTYTPIELRYFASSTDPAVAAAAVIGEGQGAPQDTPQQSGEEQIDRYRLCDGDLYQAGIDSTDADELHTQASSDPPAIEGNAYRLDGADWQKYRSIPGGEHVHDVAAWTGALYAVGSGADFRYEFEAGEIFRYLWRSVDRAASFETVLRVGHPDPGAGDTRWVHLLPTSAALMLFGYESDFQNGSASIRNARFDGAEVTALAAPDRAASIFALGSAPLPDGSGLVFGVDIEQDPLRYALFHVSAEGDAALLDQLAGQRVVDIGVYPDTGEVLYLTLAGDTYPAPDSPTSFEAAVLVAPIDAPGVVTVLAVHESAVEPLSLAYWQDALFLGTAIGEVLAARTTPTR